uniref:beta-ketoacyl-[acyl-carrier-protein] synthase I n=1 Tax=Blastobotrys adeninivorans TaxID=409370 RepID=A0A060TGL6_BLAAD
MAAAKMALEDAQWNPESTTELEETGVAVGSGIGGFDALYENAVNFHTAGYRKVSPLFVPSLLNNMAAGHISIAHKLRGPNHAVSTACTTGAHAIGDAANMIKLGMANVMVAGSTEASIHPLAVAGFARAKALATKFNDTPQKASRPFDANRDGFVIGEGAGVVIVEELEHAKARGAPIYAEVAGYGMSGDGHHITAPLQDGDGAYRSMAMALHTGAIDRAEVDYINAHATSTPLGDVAESRAITRLLDDRHPSQINVSSTKGATGHLLGGAGAVEAIFTLLAIRHGMLPPTLNLTTIDPEFECNYVPKVAQQHRIRVALTNSFGFGGTNATLAFKAM